MSVLPPRYLVPPVGVRTEKPDESGNLTRRDPDTGPYGVFIENNELLALPCPADHVPAYGPYWHRATDQLRLLLWGSEEDRITAADTLDSLNIEIDVQSTEMRQPLGTGFIEVDNWRNAGSQLRLALRDLHVYRSTARFEDVRDFIWERIQRNNYPTEWRVTRQEFEAQIQNTTNYYNALRERDGLDNEDGIFYELELEEGRRHEELAEELGQSPPPAYDLPPPYIHSGAERAITRLPIGEGRLAQLLQRHSSRHREARMARVTGQPRPRPAAILPAPSFRVDPILRRRPIRRDRLQRQDRSLGPGSPSRNSSHRHAAQGPSSGMRHWVNFR